MKHHRVFYTLFIAVAFLAFTGQSCDTPQEAIDTIAPVSVITSFDECIDAGYPAMESYPRQCRDAAGNLFVEVISEEVVETLPKVDEINTLVPDTTPKPVVKPGDEYEPEDHMEADLNSINFLDTPSQSPEYEVTKPGEDEAFDYSGYDSEGRYYTDPDYDPNSTFDIDAYNNDTVEVYDSPAVSVDWAEEDYSNDSYYEYTDSEAEYNTCVEGTTDYENGETYYCIDGGWVHELYAY